MRQFLSYLSNVTLMCENVSKYTIGLRTGKDKAGAGCGITLSVYGDLGLWSRVIYVHSNTYTAIF